MKIEDALEILLENMKDEHPMEIYPGSLDDESDLSNAVSEVLKLFEEWGLI